MPSSKTAALSSRFAIYAALVGNVLVAATKLAAAMWTGSSAMLSEGIHSIVDTGNELLLLYGIHRAARRPDRNHPLGHGREIYFWSFIVALLVFAAGACVSIYEGVSHVLHPAPVENVAVSYIVLALSVLFDGTSWVITMKTFRGKRAYSELLDAVHESKDPPSFIVLFEDSAALIGLAIAFLGIFLSQLLKQPVFDGIASILIGLVLAITATLLARETKGLLIGERADQSIVDSILRLTAEMDGVAHANEVLTIHLAPDQIMVALSIEFADELRTSDIEARVVDLEREVREAHPAVVALFVKPQTCGHWREVSARRLAESIAD
ncbi:MAG TPA: cation diffusion facilitator family transporter [Polyangiales bacterium]